MNGSLSESWFGLPSRLSVTEASLRLAFDSQKWMSHFSVKDMLNDFVASIEKAIEKQPFFEMDDSKVKEEQHV
ncbi:hypothetical protein [Geobacillus stearothermophilus]